MATAIIGGGVIGLSIARRLSLAGISDIVIIESCNSIGMVTSSRNSEVIHAGLYYQPGSLKAQLCVEGRRMLIDYCIERDIVYKNYGKLIVANKFNQHNDLQNIIEIGKQNGLTK